MRSFSDGEERNEVKNHVLESLLPEALVRGYCWVMSARFAKPNEHQTV